ncbi:MAG: putative short-subunit dehydrogenase-like oxidoreductase (DUF2520 family) [Myxococcota bacterium]|jgi:predicted short-subunit dehydrogenase-like oxidoreductase (DUF2520 family)
MTRVFVWGAGRCGRSLANALQHAGHEIVGTWNRTREAAELGGDWPCFFGPERPEALDRAEVVWITVLDGILAEAAGRCLGPEHIALHAAGAEPAMRIRVAGALPRSVAAVHPLQSFAEPMAGPEHMTGVWFGIQGEDAAVRMGQKLVEDMRGHSFVVADEDAKALYHAACCVASNAMVALADQAVGLFAAAGVDRADALAALSPLISGTAANLAGAAEARDVLTGPIARGDEATVARHEAAIGRRVPEVLGDYQRVNAAIRRLVRGE